MLKKKTQHSLIEWEALIGSIKQFMNLTLLGGLAQKVRLFQTQEGGAGRQGQKERDCVRQDHLPSKEEQGVQHGSFVGDGGHSDDR